jgi:hypothetical protein
MSGIIGGAGSKSGVIGTTELDYEEGIWVPNQGSAITLVGSFNSSGTYIKVGNLVTLQGVIGGSTSVALSGAGNTISSIPFQIAGNRVLSFNVVANNGASAAVPQYAWSSGVYSITAMSATASYSFAISYIAT